MPIVTRSNAKRAMICAIACALGAPLRAQTACPEPPPSPAASEPATPEEFRARIENSRLRYLYFACLARLDNARRAEERARARQGGRLEDFLGDDTLQKGDVIVTDQGFRVYRGAETPRADDFRRLEEGAAPRHRGRLDDLERASRAPGR